MVRKVFTGLIALACLVSSFSLFGQKKEDEVAYVDLKFKETPMVKYVNETNIEKADSKWLIVEVHFTPREKKESKDKVQWLDELTVKYEVLLPSTYKGKNVFAMLSGEVTYWAIPLDGKKHVFEGFVPPQIIDRYLRPGLKINKKTLETSIGAKVTFYDKNRKQLAQYFYTIKGEDAQTMEKAFDRASDSVEGGVLYVKNSVYSRNDTPWEFINFGSCDLIKKNEKQP